MNLGPDHRQWLLPLPRILGIPVQPPLNMLLELTKFRIVALSTLSAATGYLAAGRGLHAGIATAMLGVLLLAMGACALNQTQDRELDARMSRTRNRPIPRGSMKPAAALAIAWVLMLAGFSLLWLAHSSGTALIGLFAVAWYNGFYTYIKRVWSFAVVPGALIGALPPAIGWTAAGGSLQAPPLFALAFFFFIWQVPHFWLLLFSLRDDYEESGLPSPTQQLSARQFANLTFIWMLSAFASSLLLPLYGLIRSPWSALGLLACGLWFARESWKLIRQKPENAVFQSSFRSINLFALLVMALLVLDALLA